MELRIFHNPFFDREESSVYMPNCKTPPSAFPASPEHIQLKGSFLGLTLASLWPRQLNHLKYLGNLKVKQYLRNKLLHRILLQITETN